MELRDEVWGKVYIMNWDENKRLNVGKNIERERERERVVLCHF